MTLLLAVFWLGSACRQTHPPGIGASQAVQTATPSNGVSAVVLYDVGVRPRAIAVAELDGDGHPDVAVANAGDDTVTVLFGDADGQLHNSTSFEAGGEPSDIDAVDIDRDGDIDLVVANHETTAITVLINDGHGHFVPAPGSPFDSGARPHIHGLATADFDDDGWTDVAVESADTKEIRVLRGGPDGLSAPVSVSIGTMPYYRLGVGAVTGDRPNILVPGHGDNTVRAIASEGGILRDGEWKIQLDSKPWMVVSGDVNGDRRDDIVVVESDAVSLWLASDHGFVRASGSPFSIRGATEAAMGDLDGDGAADVAVGPWDGDEVTLLIGQSTAVHRVRMCERPIGLAIADLDGDGRGELLATCTNTNKLAITTVAPR